MSITREIIDIHAHIFPAKIASRAADNIVNYYGIPRMGDGTAEGLLQGAENFKNIRFLISSATIKPEHAQAGNDFLLNTAKTDNRFIPLASFHPGMGVSAAAQELERAKSLGAVGVKLHPDFQHFAIDDPTAIEIYRICAQLSLPVLFHVGDTKSDLSTPKRMAYVAEKLPELKVIAAHLCGYSVWDEAEEYLIGTAVYTETSESLFLQPDRVLELIRKHGVDRVMFGSDFPLWSTEHSFAPIDALPLTEDEKQKIYCDNAKKLFGL